MTDREELPGMLAVAKGVAEQKWPHTMDAKVWAEEFNSTLVERGHQPFDPGWLIGWFANAIMAGYDTANQRAAAALSAQQPVAWGKAHVCKAPSVLMTIGSDRGWSCQTCGADSASPECRYASPPPAQQGPTEEEVLAANRLRVAKRYSTHHDRPLPCDEIACADAVLRMAKQ